MSFRNMKLSYVWQEGFDCPFLSHIVEKKKIKAKRDRMLSCHLVGLFEGRRGKVSPAVLYSCLEALWRFSGEEDVFLLPLAFLLLWQVKGVLLPCH